MHDIKFKALYFLKGYIFFLPLFFFISCWGPGQKKQNRLQYASSPYLKEHADNPVDWYEWGEEALNKAKKENKPLLISIGYASCHWCHVMEKESFMDTAVARVMNENFICIKVDREERPDIDNIYMNALQLLSGNTGWPLNAFALPDGKPFYAGTYYTRKSWINLLKEVSKSYHIRYKLVETQAQALVNGIAEEDELLINTLQSKQESAPIDTKGLYESIYQQTDHQNGGFKGAPKFPTPALAEFMLQQYYISGNKEALDLATTTLKKMALGGIYDQVGGGFARYATDSLWRIPHFEKMLYDNGLLVSAYAHAYEITKDNFYKKVISETLDFIDHSLAAPGGGYYSSLNADSEDGEGDYYSWKKESFDRITGGDKIMASYFNVAQLGNWAPAKNILYANQIPAEFAALNQLDPGAFSSKLMVVRDNLYKERNKRTRPTIDTKIITSWNAILLKAYTDAYAATGAEAYLTKAIACAGFLEKQLIAEDGSIKRNYKDGKAMIGGFLDDYAWTAAAFIRLYETNFDTHWLTIARQVTEHAVKKFFNNKTNLFYYAEKQTDLVVRKTEIFDDAIPSSNAVLAKVLFTLGTVYDDTLYTNRGVQMYRSVEERVKRTPRYYLQWCSLAYFLSAGNYEVVIMGKEALKKNKELQQTYLPTSIIMGSTHDETLPMLANKLPKDKTLIYVCTGKVCKRPEEEARNALEQLNSRKERDIKRN